MRFYVILGIILAFDITLMTVKGENHTVVRKKRFVNTEDIVGIVSTIIDLWELVDSKIATNEIDLGNLTQTIGKIDLSFLNRKQAQITNGIKSINTRLDRMQEQLVYSADYTVDLIVSALPKIFRTEQRMYELKSIINQIKAQERDYLRYLNNQSALERHTLEDWALSVSSHRSDSIRNLLAKLHANVSPRLDDAYGQSLFQLIQDGDSRNNMCELQLSQQEQIYHMYNLVSIADLKGYTMLQFAWMLLKMYDKGNFTAEAELMRDLYLKRAAEKMDAAKTAMMGADRSRYKCDPRRWKEGENYVRLTKLLQGYIENEVNLNGEGTCGNNCQYYERTEYHGCFKQQFCAQQRPCHGEVLHCTYYDSDMNICQSSDDSDRRYDWIEYENAMIFGHKGTCPNRMHKVDSWWRYLFWHCSYCFCLCDDMHPSSDRYFNLRESKSDVANNKVITGVRFVKENQIVHIQIQEGILEERGLVNKSSMQWKPIDAYSVRDNDAKSGRDYHTMTYVNRAIDLDDNIAPTSHALTGLRFRLIGKSLNLEIAATPFDFDSGRLHAIEETLWIGNENTDGNPNQPRSEIKLSEPDVPTRSGATRPNSRHDQFIQFRESSLRDDASQSTVPFIDTQPLTSDGAVLSGIGVHHRGSQKSGGFVALKLFTYDFTPHMDMSAKPRA